MAQKIGSSAELFIVDDDAIVRDVLSVAFTHAGYQVTVFAEGNSFFDAVRLRIPSCVILDMHMPGRSGIDILKELNAKQCDTLIFVISAQRDIPLAVDAIKNGAFNFIEKPFELDAIVMRVRRAVQGWRHPARNGIGSDLPSRNVRSYNLTPRERDVLEQIVDGLSNKEVGSRLGISHRTVEVHRARIMEKLGARNAAGLVRIVLTETVRP